MDDYRPQDEYFEWDDIMVYKGPSGDDDAFNKNTPLGYPSTVTRSFSFDSAESLEDDFAWSDDSSLSTTPSSLSSTDSLSLCSLKEDKTAELDFPSYDDTSCPSCVTISLGPALALTAPSSPILDPVSDSMLSGDLQDSAPLSRTISRGEIGVVARDDSALNIQPFQNVNYLTHDWCEEDIPSTWRYVVSRRFNWTETVTRRKSPFNNIPRYENALWRSWAQRRFQLKTVSPEIINWMKSCDETTLYGPFMMTADEFTPTAITASCARSSSLPHNPLKPLLKQPKMSEILLRGSIPTFVSTRRANHEIHQSTFQAKPSYDPSVACPGMSVDQRLELTSVALAKLGLRRCTKSVRFLNEVEQCEIIKVRVSSKNMRRTLKKLPSTTLDKACYNLPTPPRIKTGHWSPDSLWSYNPENSPETETAENKPWSGIVSENELSTLRPAPIRIHKQASTTSSVPEPPPRSKHHTRTSSISVPLPSTSTSLAQHLQTLKHEHKVDDELDYLIAMASPRSSSLSSSPPSSSSDSSCSEDTVSDEDEIPFFGTGDITDEKAQRVREERRGGVGAGKSAREVGIGVRIVGDENEAERQLLSEMEEYDLVLG